MPEPFLYEQLDGASRMGFLKRELPEHLPASLNPRFELRPYQVEAVARFLHCLDNDYPGKDWPLHFAFNMATGSGKTLIMAGLIAHLYTQGHRHFLFFVNSTNIIEKTKDNFLNPASSKYLFAPRLEVDGRPVNIAEVANFEDACPDDINICFTTIQKLHMDLTAERENSIMSWPRGGELPTRCLAQEPTEVSVRPGARMCRSRIFPCRSGDGPSARMDSTGSTT